MIIAARIIPSKIDNRASLYLNCRIEATRLPLHAPVPGRGIPTNNVNAKKPYFLYFSDFTCNFSSYLVKNEPKVFVFFNQWIILVPNNNRKGTGRKLLMIQIGIASFQSIAIDAANINAPLSSISGTKEIINKANNGEIEENKLNIFSTII